MTEENNQNNFRINCSRRDIRKDPVEDSNPNLFEENHRRLHSRYSFTQSMEEEIEAEMPWENPPALPSQTPNPSSENYTQSQKPYQTR